VGRSIREYGRLVFLNWWALVGLVGTVIGLGALFVSGGITLPVWLGLLVAVLCLLTAQFLAFHRVRVQRDGGGPVPQTTGGINVSGGVHFHFHQPPPPE
jgi:hypothetical protein